MQKKRRMMFLGPLVLKIISGKGGECPLARSGYARMYENEGDAMFGENIADGMWEEYVKTHDTGVAIQWFTVGEVKLYVRDGVVSYDATDG